jgi:hypothetical protein
MTADARLFRMVAALVRRILSPQRPECDRHLSVPRPLRHARDYSMLRRNQSTQPKATLGQLACQHRCAHGR